jgi:hypothetical protein
MDDDLDAAPDRALGHKHEPQGACAAALNSIAGPLASRAAPDKRRSSNEGTQSVDHWSQESAPGRSGACTEADRHRLERRLTPPRTHPIARA